jgi:hypothetical protein
VSSPLAPKTPIMGNFLEKFSLPDRPEGAVPEIPLFLDELPDNKLMETYTMFMSWVSFAKADMVVAEIEEERAANDLKLLEAKTLISQWSDKEKGDTVTLAKARRDTEPAVVEAQQLYSEKRAYRKLVESVFERCERGAQVISRELSRRISLSPQERRQGRYTA